MPPLDVELADEMFDFFRVAEYGWVRARIVLLALRAGEFHAEQMAEIQLPQPNMIGAAVNALATWGVLEKKNRRGEQEHRSGSNPASHGRASYVWRLTDPRGRQFAARMPSRLAEIQVPEVHQVVELSTDLIPLDSEQELF